MMKGGNELRERSSRDKVGPPQEISCCHHFQMMSPLLAALIMGSCAAMPLRFNQTTMCNGGLCEKKDMLYERILPAQPGYQWDDAGGYCGSWSIQRATLMKGAYISQQQVRDHTSPGGGNDNEILSTNIEEALNNLKIAYEGFDYVNEPLPQQEAYAQWLKTQLVGGDPVVWMIMWNAQAYPIYNLEPPAGMYGHVEPVIGIQSNHPLNDTTVYDDDVAVHFDDGDVSTVYRAISTLPGEWAGPGHQANCRPYSYCMATYAFGWALKGFADEAAGVPASLRIDPWLAEPDTRSGEAASALQGTLTVSDLTAGAAYDIFRWDTVEDAFTYSEAFKKASFTAANETYVYVDDTSFQSDSTTYYRCVPQEATVM